MTGMHTGILNTLIAIGLLATTACARLAAGEAKQLMSNGGFDQIGADGAPTGWELTPGASCETAPASRYVRLEADEGKLVSIYRAIPVNGVRALELSFRARWKDVKRGKQPWFDARVMLDFKDGDNKNVGHSPPAPYFTGTSDGWQERTLRFAVPDGAKVLAFMPCLFNAKSGTFELDDLSLTAIDPALLGDRSAPAASAVEKKEVVLDGGKPAPQALHVDGSKLLRADGSEIWLQGVSIDSLQWSNTGEGILASVVESIEAWKCNVVRLPMRENRWFGQDAGQTDMGEAYRKVISDAVQAASSRGAYLILDLHRFRAPMDTDVAFWKDAATTYKDNPAVIFEIFNEPYGVSWEEWRNGGALDGNKRDGVVNETSEGADAKRTVGMQALVDAVRATGARNLILAGGLDYSYDLTGILKGFALAEHDGLGIAYVAHCYPWKSGWQTHFLDVAKVHPVVMTEVGCDVNHYSFIPPDRDESPYTWAPDMIACIQRNKLHWTAFSFHPHCGPPMLMDQKTYTPTPFWGGFVKAALLGAHFESDRLR